MRVMLEFAPGWQFLLYEKVFKEVSASLLEWQSARCYRIWLQSVLPSTQSQCGPHHWESCCGSEPGAIWPVEESCLHHRAGMDRVWGLGRGALMSYRQDSGFLYRLWKSEGVTSHAIDSLARIICFCLWPPLSNFMSWGGAPFLLQVLLVKFLLVFVHVLL